MAPVNEKVKAATEVAVRLKRCLAIFRLYTSKHDLAAGALEELHQNAVKHLAGVGSIRFEVEAHRLLSEGEVVLEDDGRDESIIMRLYSEGVLGITFKKGVDKAELSRYVEFWWQALSGFLSSEHSFSTLVWEEEFKAVSTEFRERLDLSDGDKSDRAAGRKAVLDAANSPTPPDSASNVDKANIEKLSAIAGAPELRNLTPRPLDAIKLTLTPEDRASILDGIATNGSDVAQRALFEIWKALPFALPEHKSKVIEFIESVYLALLERGTLDELEGSLSKVSADEPDDRGRHDEFLAPLCKEAAIDKIASQLATANDAQARAILSLLPDAVFAPLLARLQKVGAADRRAIMEILKTKHVLPEDFAFMLLDLGPVVAVHLFELASTFSNAHADMLLRAAMVHDDPIVRAKAIATLQPPRVARYRSLLLRALRDEDSRVRETVLGLFVRAKRPEAVDILEISLRNPTTTATARAQAAKALATLPGPRAQRLLESLLRSSDESPEARATAAGALGSFESSRAVLEQESKRRFAEAMVRDACKAALRRLDDARRKGSA
ncbi:MAG: HEAT repeat domain-containing protein [Deltaproteobacteria bacterium]|nr:HEAT repeat domain-containing protein [Deltaproteobacteria bacterium]